MTTHQTHCFGYRQGVGRCRNLRECVNFLRKLNIFMLATCSISDNNLQRKLMLQLINLS